MRVNVDSKALSDPRFARLGARLGMNRHEALGRCVPVWMQAYENRNATIKAIDVDALAEVNGLSRALVEVDLAQSRGKSIRLRGVEERIQFLLVQDAKREKANAARIANARALPPGNISDENTKSNRSSPGKVPGRGPYSLDQSPAPDLAQALDPEAGELAAAAAGPSLPGRSWLRADGQAMKKARERVAAGDLTAHDVAACWDACEREGIDRKKNPDPIAAKFVTTQRPARKNGRIEPAATDAAYEEVPPWAQR